MKATNNYEHLSADEIAEIERLKVEILAESIAADKTHRKPTRRGFVIRARYRDRKTDAIDELGKGGK